MKSIVVLGSTGSIGVSTLDLVRRFPDEFRARGLVAGRNLKLLAAQIREFVPEWVSIREKEGIPLLRKLLGERKMEILWGESGATSVATASGVDIVVAAIVGSAGLVPTLEAVRAGKEVALANKEALVMAGEIFMREANKKGVRLFPVDSEHSAVFQCLQGNRREEVERIILTASGGPFLRVSLKSLERVTVKRALKHPNWKMGRKITVDSATMMNKGLEVVEARWLFDINPSQVEVVIHPQSIVHSMVLYQDGSIIAQLGVPDMRIPIAYALSYPHRLKVNCRQLKLTELGELTFLPVEKRRYPALDLAYQALAVGGTMPAVLNAANEVAVAAFLERRIGFRKIHRVIERAMEAHASRHPNEVQEILEADRWAREKALTLIDKK
ncbi:MAG: 1-deoxy-D-xylulose-5-phosphate reductoisomerase [Deltaproteobacteria bacterium RIFCSPLOWO2_02_56_12]|nr:MAG: 1-deoxy-D-xylulose-5-phosphate reductoisomerase [Deltaproteobacteria bacterium GWD2_55_8]OGP95913.1 MAG: 1-deoxy-D-xylulose-5-phosphate reductoisomerase [Deltaproteobacteria bacterium RBG_16_55_12]OGQ56587.1 MAG: 1-deoxy-D-xylulose-5-phosphate reductoisomerase [Deltaproteobacteria bacterium RIFCSPLOWO2_02_56_12]OGQ73107.1 MAG: 1-deoxy-D-xylulose-5-phosphate reductoisomerase [Deltaproteobacteria bacterium RIFCSPLOWO2_12_55_13]